MTDHDPIICPICRKKRPTYEDVLAYKDAQKDSEIYRLIEAYNTCCNPLCKGEWGTNCWHCHHPKFLEACPDERIFEVAFVTREVGQYWNGLMQLSSDRLVKAHGTCSEWRWDHTSDSEWRVRKMEMGVFLHEAVRGRDALLVTAPLKLKAETIMECQLAVCKYCDASAKSGETTMHTCVAAPLKEMLNDIALQLYGEEAASG